VMPVLILGVPLYDTCSVVLLRLRRGRSPFSPDLNHLAHRLHRLGLSRRRTVLLIYLMTLAVGLNAVLLATGPALGKYCEGTIILVQVLAVFGVIVVLEMVSFGGRAVRLATPVRAGLELGADDLRVRLAGEVTRLSPGGAELELAEMGGELAGRLLAARESGRLTLGFAAPFEETVLEAAVRGVERTRSGGWRLSLDFGALGEDARRRLGFALDHYRALGER